MARIETEIQILKQQEMKRKALDDEIKKVQAENEKLKKELSYSWIYFFVIFSISLLICFVVLSLLLSSVSFFLSFVYYIELCFS